MKGVLYLKIDDEGHIIYDIDEVPLPLLFKDLSYQIISSKDNKKLLPVLRIALSKEVRFLLGSNLIDILGENDITYYIDDGLQLLIDAVCLKFIKHIKENAKNGNPRKAEASSYWLEVFSQKDDDKVYLYTPHCDYDEDDEEIASIDTNKLLAESFLYEVVEPSTKYLLDKYCDKHYEVIVSEITEKVYETVNYPLDGMTEEETIACLKNEEYKETTNVTVKRTFKGYTKRDSSSSGEPSKN